MKKALAIALIMVMVLRLVACDNKGNEEAATNNTEVNHETEQSKENESSKDDEQSKETETEVTASNYWIDNYKNWGEQKEDCPLTLFDGQFTAPIDIKNVNSFAKNIIYNNQDISDINTVMNAETTVDNKASVWLKYGETDENGKYKNSIELELKDFTKKRISTKECFNNNWWSITELYYPQKALGIYVDDPEYHKMNTKPLLNKVVEQLGGPKHIYTYLKLDGDYYKSINYAMCYEYTDFTIEIDVIEVDTGTGVTSCSIGYITYAPKEYWERELEKRKVEYSEFEVIK